MGCDQSFSDPSGQTKMAFVLSPSTKIVSNRVTWPRPSHAPDSQYWMCLWLKQNENEFGAFCAHQLSVWLLRSLDLRSTILCRVDALPDAELVRQKCMRRRRSAAENRRVPSTCFARLWVGGLTRSVLVFRVTLYSRRVAWRWITLAPAYRRL